jgi:hypothetical protein
MRKLSAAASIVVLLALVAFLYGLAQAPMHGVRDVAECDRAYAKAKSRMDTIAVDHTSFRDTSGRRYRGRCGITRPQPWNIAGP